MGKGGNGKQRGRENYRRISGNHALIHLLNG